MALPTPRDESRSCSIRSSDEGASLSTCTPFETERWFTGGLPPGGRHRGRISAAGRDTRFRRASAQSRDNPARCHCAQRSVTITASGGRGPMPIRRDDHRSTTAECAEAGIAARQAGCRGRCSAGRRGRSRPCAPFQHRSAFAIRRQGHTCTVTGGAGPCSASQTRNAGRATTRSPARPPRCPRSRKGALQTATELTVSGPGRLSGAARGANLPVGTGRPAITTARCGFRRRR
jgi:hypothetical protein